MNCDDDGGGGDDDDKPGLALTKTILPKVKLSSASFPFWIEARGIEKH